MSGLVIGLGNPDRGDDGIGVRVVRTVAGLAPPGIVPVLVEDPTALLDLWSGVDHVVVVDAMTSGRVPGSVVALDVTDTPLPAEGWAAGGTHALGLAAAVELSRALGRLPRRLVVIGVEAASATAGADLSDPVGSALDTAVGAVLDSLSATRG